MSNKKKNGRKRYEKWRISKDTKPIISRRLRLEAQGLQQVRGVQRG